MATHPDYVQQEVMQFFDTAELQQLARNGQWKKVKTTCKTIGDMRVTLECARDYEKNTRRLRLVVKTPSTNWWFSASDMDGYGIPQDGTPDFELIDSLPSKLRRTSKIDIEFYNMRYNLQTTAFWRSKLLQGKISKNFLWWIKHSIEQAEKDVEEMENSRANRLAKEIEEARKIEEEQRAQAIAEATAKLQRIEGPIASLKKEGIDVMALGDALQNAKNELARLTA